MNQITINKSSAAEIHNWFLEVNQEFIPPLENFVDFETYSAKIFINANRFELYNDDVLRGLLAAYFNHENKIAFVTLFGISKDFRTLSNIRRLFISFLKEFLKDHRMEYVELEVHHENTSLLRFYNKLKFTVKENRIQSVVFQATRQQCEYLVE